jgi:hypothetical protein
MEEIEMAIQSSTQPNVRSDARQRTDDFHREYVASEGGPVPTTQNGKPKVNVDGNLLPMLEKSAQTMRHVAENVENRGLKLLLKVMAQERAYMVDALRQAMAKNPIDPLDSSQKSSATRLQEGLEDIQASMTVQRQGREKLMLSHLVQEEESLLAAYARALEGDVPDSLRKELTTQQSLVSQFYTRLQSVGEGIDPIVARVFDTRIEGEAAVARLREQGLDPSQIDAAPINQLAKPMRPTAVKPSSPKNTMAAGAFSGAIVGGIVGLALAAFVWLAPQLVGWVTVGPWALLIGAIIIGAVFGTVFGLLIGQNQREDDIAVTADSLINGEILVVAYPKPHQVVLVEDILQVYHARELNR